MTGVRACESILLVVMHPSRRMLFESSTHSMILEIVHDNAPSTAPFIIVAKSLCSFFKMQIKKSASRLLLLLLLSLS
jgi:hypothetical protein